MEQLAVSKQTIDTTKNAIHPYPPSWIDRLMDWVQRLPGPVWLFYLGVTALLVLARTIIAWSDGSLPVGTFLPLQIFFVSGGMYLLFLLHYLDDRAGVAFTDFRPVLNADDAGYERLRYQLTNMPARPALLWSLPGLVFGLIGGFYLIPKAVVQLAKLLTSPAATVVDFVTSGFSWMMIPVLVYHTIRQLRLVSRIYTQHTNVNIFETGPLYALSRVTALTAIALLSIPYLDLTFGPTAQQGGGLNPIFFAVFAPLALVVFVWPLLGAHRLLQEGKARRKSEIARRLEAVTDELHRRADAGDYSDMAGINNATESLVRERDVLDKVSTWPWEPETVRVVVTALLLPVVFWIVTRVLERLGF
jgi:hypothetical protein